MVVDREFLHLIPCLLNSFRPLPVYCTIRNVTIQLGAPLRETTWQLCHRPYQVNAHSRLILAGWDHNIKMPQLSQGRHCNLWKPYSALSVQFDMIYSFRNLPRHQY